MLFLIGAAESASGAVFTLNPTADTDTQSDVAAGTNATLNLSQWSNPIIKFDLSSVSGTVSDGTLRLYFAGGMAATTVTVSTTSNDTWIEGDTKPTVGSVITTKTQPATGAGYIDINITAHVQSKMSGNKTVSVFLANTLGNWTSFNSRQSATNKPQLVVTATGGGSTNLALNKPVTVSSIESAGFAGSLAVDGNAGTRWSSQFADPQWIYVDLQATYAITDVKLNWEVACGRDYTIQTSPNATTWTTIKTVTGNTTSGLLDYPVSGSGRYVRVNGTARATAYGYSLWAFEVYGTAGGGSVPAAPTNLTVQPGNAQATLTWTASPTAATYNVYRGTSAGGEGTIAIATGVVTTSYANTGLTNGTTYFYKVAGVNAAGTGPQSTEASATPVAPTVPVTGISINPPSASVAINGTTTLTATVTPSNASNKTLSWLTSNASVATVSPAGVVRGIAAGSAVITARSTDGSNVTSNASAITVTSGSGGTATRPSYNTGNGFFVLNGKLYDANGVQFTIRGVNKLHWDASSPGIVKTNANTVRWVVDFNQTTSLNLALMQQTINSHMVPMPGNWDGTCDDESALSAIVDKWVAQASAWKTIDRYMILNIANELGSNNSTAWRDAYITAVSRLRAAGYLCTIAIDAGGCGQDNDDLANFATAVFNSDPQKNIIFDQHIYGNWGMNGQPSWAIDLTAGLDRLSATGLCFVIGEFGPGRNIGPSPTPITPGQIITAADARGFGWMAWAWDDPAFNAADNWFALSFNGDYNSSADLTTYGKDVVENPNYGLKARAVKQTHF